MTTFTASTALASARAPHTGIQAKVFRFSGGNNLVGSTGDVVVLCKVPNAATVFDVQARVNVRNDTGGELRIYLTRAGRSETTTLASIGSLSVSLLASPLKFTSANGFAPFRLSITDEQALQYAWLKCQFTGSTATASFSIDGFIFYAMNIDI